MNSPNPHQKKGMSGCGKAGLGCFTILVLLFLGGGFIVAKYSPELKEMGSELEKDPALAAVWALEFNPAFEVISKDNARREITFKSKLSGETVTRSYDDVAKGRLLLNKDKEP